MKKILSGIFLTYFCLPSFAETGNGTLSFFVRDAENGYGTKSEILISGNNQTQSFRTDEGGYFVFNGVEGRYDISINSENHQSLKTYFYITPGNTINVEALLDRKNKTKVEYQKLNHAIIQGYVIDKESGKPMKDVSVSMEGAQKAVTDEKGYFSFSSSEYSEMKTEKDKPVRKSYLFSKAGYTSYIVQDLFLAPTKINLKIDLKKGKGEETKKEFQHILDGTPDDVELYEKSVPSQTNQKNNSGIMPMGCSLPSDVRVGTSCSCTSCSNVSVMSLQYYSESGLDDEWISSWQYESLAAGSIPYRTYGGWYVNNPVNANYDIANTTCNQVWGGTVYANPQSAAQSTSGDMLTADGVNPARSEYSAQNNYGGTSYNCSDCNAGGSGVYACYSDNVCCGYSPAGHGRGMCQWGSQYWAQGGQNHQWMINHYYIAQAGYSLCSSLNNPPTALSVQQASCPGIGVWLNWQNSGNGWIIDVTDNAGWPYWWNIDVTALIQVVCPGGFAPQNNPPGNDYLQFQPNTTYHWRIWDGTAHVYGQSFITPVCTYSDNNCTGTFTDFGGASTVYYNNEDWTQTISPTNALSVTMNFTSFDLEDQYDYLYIHDGNSIASPLIGTYTGVNSPGTITSSGPDLTFHFVSDPFVQNAGWEATWSCTPNTTGISENNNEVTIFQNVSEGIIMISSSIPINAEVSVYDVLGNKILNSQKSYFTIMNLNLSKKVSGIYFVKISGDKIFKVYKVIKN